MAHSGKKGEETQEELKSERNRIGAVKTPPHVDLYKMPGKSTASKKITEGEQV